MEEEINYEQKYYDSNKLIRNLHRKIKILENKIKKLEIEDLQKGLDDKRMGK